MCGPLIVMPTRAIRPPPGPTAEPPLSLDSSPQQGPWPAEARGNTPRALLPPKTLPLEQGNQMQNLPLEFQVERRKPGHLRKLTPLYQNTLKKASEPCSLLFHHERSQETPTRGHTLPLTPPDWGHSPSLRTPGSRPTQPPSGHLSPERETATGPQGRFLRAHMEPTFTGLVTP